MPTGTVKWFNNAKGYGFILPDSGGEDLFAHYSSIEMEGYKTLKAGQPVSFDVIEGAKGLHATNIQLPDKHKVATQPSAIAPERPKQAAPTESSTGKTEASFS